MTKSGRSIIKKALVILCVAVIAAATLPVVSCAPKAAPEEAVPVVNIRVHSQMPVGHFITQTVDLFIKEAETRSKGSLKFAHYPAAQLYTEVGIVDVLQKGGVEMAQIQPMSFFGKVPEIEAGFLPGFYKDQDHFYRLAYDIQHGGGLMDKLFEPAFEKKANVKMLNLLGLSITLCTFTNKPVYKLEDYKGLRIRSGGKPISVFLQTLGIAPVVISSGEIYMALQRGTIDGTFHALSAFYERKLYESAKYCQYYYTGPSNQALAVNVDFWNTLTTSQKRAILEAALVAELYSTQKAMEEESKARKELTSAGVEFYDFPPSEVKRIQELARPALIKMLKDDLGEEVSTLVMQMAEKTQDAKTSWQDCCKEHNKRLLEALK